MEYHFKIHRQIRGNLLKILKETSFDELLEIPDGFNNNIFWNIAHCVATQQLLHYYLSGNDFRIDPTRWVEKYKKGTLPSFDVTITDIEDLAFLLKETSAILMKDYDKALFKEYKSYSTSFGIDLRNIQDAIIFNNTHESLHYGYVLAQKRALLGHSY